MEPQNFPPIESPARRGKIARLPHSVREQLNQRLQNGEGGKKLVEWLNALPETQAVLGEQFEDQPISEQNLSQWRNGGYRDWLKKQEDVEFAHSFCTDAGELAVSPALADNVAFRAAVRIAVLLRDLNECDSPERQLEALSVICREVSRLRRGNHEDIRLDLDRRRLALAEKRFEDQRVKEAPKEPLKPITLEDFRLMEQRDNL